MKVYQTNQIEEVVAAFRDHNVIAFPTDTVYGVGVLYGDTEDLDPDSKRKLYASLMRKGFSYSTVTKALSIDEDY